MQSGEQALQNTGGGNEIERCSNNLSADSSSSQEIDSITVLETSPTGRIYSYGTKRGTVHLFDLHQNRVFNTITPENSLGIEQMSWSDDGSYLCFSNSEQRVFVISVTVNESTPEPIVETKAEISMKDTAKGPITQLLFRSDLSCFLVSASKNVNTISLTSFSIIHSTEPTITRCRWIPHPHDSDLIIGFSPEHALVLDWDLTAKQIYVTWIAGSSEHMKVDKVIVTQDKSHILVQKSLRDKSMKDKGHHYFETSKLLKPSGLEIPASFPRDISPEIAFPLLFQPDNRLIFLSENSSVCSWQIPPVQGKFIVSSRPRLRNIIAAAGSSTSDHQDTNDTPGKEFEELFSLPGDSIDRNNFPLCTVWGKERSFLYPRNGEVVVVRCEALG
ncbi:hypothetical protein F4805DRAFT_288654 [Annulohypoxylon moriforme]|nr:hypothetical protein F4805DRAFT_288654 [Annulohypoxylon moriforme]